MARFKRLTAAEANTLTRAEILDRLEAEQAYWFRGNRCRHEPDAYREFCRIMHAAINLGEMLNDTLTWLNNGASGAGRYLDQRPDIPDAPERT